MDCVFQIGRVIGAYRVTKFLGKGGMAEVYEVELERSGAIFALKAFVCKQENADSLRKRFLVEGRLLARLQHPRLVRVHDFGFTEDGTPYYVMDVILDASGRPCTLRDAIERGISTEENVARWYSDIAEALEYVHSHGIVHRDVSLENVLVGPDGRATLSDFGVAKVLNRDLRREIDLSTITFTTDGRAMMGKTFYIAPEVRAGGTETVASDFYSLGVLVHYLLTQTWYTPGARTTDMLDLFDEQWRVILPALLSVDPADRHCPAWRDPRDEEMRQLSEKSHALVCRLAAARRRARYAAFISVGIAALALGAVLAFAFADSRAGGSGRADRPGTARARREAKVLCTRPFALRKAIKSWKLPKREFDVAHESVEREVAKSLTIADRIDVADEAEAKAEMFGGVGRDGFAVALCTLNLQVAFQLYLGEGDYVQAARALKDIEAVSPEWAGNLLDTLPRLAVRLCGKDRAQKAEAAFRNEWKRISE